MSLHFSFAHVERITVAFHLELAVESADEKLRIGERGDRVVYTRTTSGQFELDRALSTAAAE